MTDPTTMAADKLSNADTGVWRVYSATSSYILDMNKRRGTRMPGTGIPFDGDEADGYYVSDLRQDGEWWDIVSIVNCRLGEYLEVLTTGISDDPDMYTYRRSTVIRRIERLDVNA
jgi:hypothetical protein